MIRGLIGYPLGHSYSAPIHTCITGKPYSLIPLKEEELEPFLLRKEFEGINVTIPYKQAVIPYLDEIDTHAKEIGAVNCIVNRNGSLYGTNTDYDGFAYLLEKNDISIQGKVVAILGTGGAYKAVLKVIEDKGAQTILSVSRSKKEGCITYEELYARKRVDVIVNTTPVGMYPNNDETPLDISRMEKVECVIDIIYNPLRTKLVNEAQYLGIKSVGGLDMLVAQAFKADEYFENTTLEETEIDKALHYLYKEKRNIVLIGMPTCGKSAVAEHLAELLSCPFVDMDQRIEEKIQMSINEFFLTKGEDAFREVETSLAKELRNQTGWIISTGGGVIKNPLNMEYLRENGIVFFIDRDMEHLFGSKSRPLSQTREDVEKLYAERIDSYRKYSDFIISNNGTLEEGTQKIIQKIKGERK